jgi:hypothetical protein
MRRESGQAQAIGFIDTRTGNHFGYSKQVRVFDLLPSAHLAGKDVDQRCINLFPINAVGHNVQWMTLINLKKGLKNSF